MIASSNEDNLAAAISTIKTASLAQGAGHAVDLRTLAGCEAAVAAHAEESRISDILVHSAGATKGGLFPNQPDTDFIDGFALKFHAGLRLSHRFWPMLKAARRNVVIIAGGAARTPDHTFMAGSSVNAKLANYSKAMAGQGLIDDVNVNWISLGQTETERRQTLIATRASDEDKTVDAVRQERMRAEGARRLGRPDDSAALACFLCSEQARHIYGAGIAIDVGATKEYF